MRGTVDGLEPAFPLVQQLPAVYQEHDFTARFLSAFDTVLAPVVQTLDDLHAYVDPALAPDDFLVWLGSWVGVSVGAAGSPQARRQVVARAVSVHRQRGTASGIAEVARLVAGEQCTVEVVESGAATWSRSPGAALPGEAGARVEVRLVVPDPEQVDLPRLRHLLQGAAPAHVVLTVTVAAG